MADVNLAPGARIIVRDAEWLVRRVDRTSTGGRAISCVGLSEIVRDKESIFLTELEESIDPIDPVQTKFRHDPSSQYQASLLYLESLLRQSPPTDHHLYTGHRAAMDPLPYQLEPALESLKQPRQRILIADAVGLGKTLEAGILLAELIRRGRAKRIMVVTVKSMLTQFQKEMWNRFTIPLTRLDSAGLQRIRAHIPTNHNPFYSIDKSIISIDTLKDDGRYRVALEQAYWDVIVIDEAHNVAARGKTSKRSKLAQLLAKRSDTLIMLSATPHDGKPESFASLMNMLDSTALANPQQYTKEDIQGLYVRRFKKDIAAQVTKSFKEREIYRVTTQASAPEEETYRLLSNLSFQRIDQNKPRGHLFKTVLQKALFSSPQACLATVQHRIDKIDAQCKEAAEKEKAPDTSSSTQQALALDRQKLEEIAFSLQSITTEHFSKYKRLLQFLRGETAHSQHWNPKDPTDRVVLFTERRESLTFLYQQLALDLGLQISNPPDPTKDQILEMHGGMSDTGQQKVVEVFGQEKMPVRILVASDVASEGINLHYLSYRLIHFDIPWSLMVFQQRNGRIDRYGQEKQPQIAYMMTESQHPSIQGDLRILDILIKKDQQATENIGDPCAFMGVYDITKEEEITAAAIESQQTPEDFDASLDPLRARLLHQDDTDEPNDLQTTPHPSNAPDPFAWMFGSYEPTEEKDPFDILKHHCKQMPSLFENDYTYLKKSLAFLHQYEEQLNLQFFFDDAAQRIDFTAPNELKHRFRYLPSEIWPEKGGFILCSSLDTIQKEIRESRKQEHAWPKIQYLWELHPVMQWLHDRMSDFFQRQEAPVVFLPNTLQTDEVVFLMNGVIPNRKSHPLIFRWFGACFHNGNFRHVEPLSAFLERTSLQQQAIPNPHHTHNLAPLERLCPRAVQEADAWMRREQKAFRERIEPQIQEKRALLQKRQAAQLDFLELFTKTLATPEAQKKQRDGHSTERRRIQNDFNEYEQWIFDTMRTEEQPYIQIVAAFAHPSAL